VINRTIAVLDWGIGGLPTYFTLQKRLPGHGIGYFSDSGYPPYGTLGEQELEKRLKTIAQDLIDRGFSSLVVACNAMSTVLFQDKNWGLPTVGIIAPFLKRFEKSLVGATLILGGDRVTSSLIYSNCAHPQSGTTVHRSGQKLSHMIESGIRDSTRIQSAIAQITEDVQEVEQLILACTHYPAYRGFF
jgi:glutamate racemase